MSTQDLDAQLPDFDRRAFLATTTVLGVASLTAGCAPSEKPASPSELGPITSVDEWIVREAIPFSMDKNFNPAVDRMMRVLGDQVSLLGFGEGLHGGEESFTLRNRFFQRLVEAHGFSAITIEITDTRARLVNDYIAGRGPATYEAIQESGFSYGAGLYAGNRELVEWMKQYNADPTHAVKLNFYGTVASGQRGDDTTESPRRALELVFTYLQLVDAKAAARHREIIGPLMGVDADWEGPAAARAKELMAQIMSGVNEQAKDQAVASSAGQASAFSPRAALRLAVENLSSELQMRRPELVARSDLGSFNDALHDLAVARNLLELHSALARRESLDTLVSMRDAMAGEHLVYIAAREQARGKVMVHLHNAHLRRTRTKLPWYEFWPTGAHLEQLFGARFAVIGGAVGTSEANFIGTPERGSLEARFLARQSDFFIPTRRGKALAEGALAALPVRTGAARPYVPYTPLFPQSVADLDGIAFLRSVTHTRGAPPWPG